MHCPIFRSERYDRAETLLRRPSGWRVKKILSPRTGKAAPHFWQTSALSRWTSEPLHFVHRKTSGRPTSLFGSAPGFIAFGSWHCIPRSYEEFSRTPSTSHSAYPDLRARLQPMRNRHDRSPRRQVRQCPRTAAVARGELRSSVTDKLPRCYHTVCPRQRNATAHNEGALTPRQASCAIIASRSSLLGIIR